MDETRWLRRQLVEELHRAGVLADQAVADAFLAVPRHLFVPGVPPERAYRDEAIATKIEGGLPVSSSSQPAIMAVMLEQLDVRPGMRVLEIGAGTGYNAALLQHLVGPRGRVVTIDIDPEVVAWARERLAAAGYPEVVVIEGDGADGWPAEAPYDRIEVTVGVPDIAPAWAEQLRPGGVLVLPLWVKMAQLSIAFEKGEDGTLRSRSARPCGFMRIRGKLAGDERYVEVLPGVSLLTDEPDPPLEPLRALLREQPRRGPWPVGLRESFWTYLALQGEPVLSLWAEDGALVAFHRGAFGIMVAEAEPSLCLVTMSQDGEGVEALSYGGEAARERLQSALDAWYSAGRPSFESLSVTAQPLAAAAEVESGLGAIDTRWWRLRFAWR